jgi:[acyl-carrier-protein] S-malonyltransferase
LAFADLATPVPFVFLFPGQNSRDAGMIDRLVDGDPEAERTLERASDVLGRDLRAHYHATNAGMFARNRDVQIGVFLANFLAADRLARLGVKAHRSLGLSLGEYNHLVDIGALTFEQALPLIEARGVAYEVSPRGAMAALFPIDESAARDVLEQVGAGEALALAMCNAPRQQVFSGERTALDRACQLAQDQHFAQAVVFEDRLPMHSPLFAGVADQFAGALNAVAWQRPDKPYLPNVTGCFVEQPARDDFITLLSQHLHRPVLWRQSIDLVLATSPAAVFVEVGPHTVLSDLLRRRWVDRPVFHTDGSDALVSVAAAADLLPSCAPTS